MKKSITLNFWLFLALIGGHQLIGQYDDVYFDPDETYYDYSNDFPDNDDEDYAYVDGDDWDDDYEDYEYYDDYDYYYTSRIRRFHRPYSGFDFYDPCYVDMYYYDPFYYGSGAYFGSTIYIGFGNSWGRGYRGWNRYYNPWRPYGYGYNYWNRYDPWCNTGWGWNNHWHYNSWGNRYWNRGYGGWNNYYGCPTNFSGSNYYWYNNSDYSGRTYWGSHRTGSSRTSPRGPVRQVGNDSPAERAIGINQPVYRSHNDRGNTGPVRKEVARAEDHSIDRAPDKGNAISSTPSGESRNYARNRSADSDQSTVDRGVEQGESNSRRTYTSQDRKVQPTRERTRANDQAFDKPTDQRATVSPRSQPKFDRSRSSAGHRYDRSERQNPKYDHPSDNRIKSRSSERSTRSYDRSGSSSSRSNGYKSGSSSRTRSSGSSISRGSSSSKSRSSSTRSSSPSRSSKSSSSSSRSPNSRSRGR